MRVDARGVRMPWTKFFWTDWESDPALRLCSLAARGLWMDLLCLAAKSADTGHVLIGAKKPTHLQMAKLVGETVEGLTALLEELRSNGVFEETADGVIFSRRMVREARLAERSRINGAKGGNPKLLKTPAKSHGVKPEAEAEAEAEADDSVDGGKGGSSSDRSETDKNSADPPKPPKGGVSQGGLFEPPNADNDKGGKPARKTREVTPGQQACFDRFYAGYPRKEAPAAALKALIGQWSHIEGVTANDKLKTLRTGILIYRHKIAVQKVSADLIAHPATWLNQHRWKDAPAPGYQGPDNQPKPPPPDPEFPDPTPVHIVKPFLA